MGKTAEPIKVNAERLARLKQLEAFKSDYLAFIRALVAIDSASRHGEISPPVAGLHALKYLAHYGRKPQFDWDRFGVFVENYGERLIPLPESLVFALGEAWARYIDDPDADLATAFQTKGARGRRNARTTIENLTHTYQLASLIQIERVFAKYPHFSSLKEGADITLEEARARVAEKYDCEDFDASDRTLQRAWRRWGAVVRRQSRQELLGDE